MADGLRPVTRVAPPGGTKPGRWDRLNPLRMDADGLPFEAVLLARLVIVALLVKRYDLLPGPGVAFIAALEFDVPGIGGLTWPRLLFYAGAGAVLSNLAPRTGALLASSGLFLASLWNMAAFAQSRLFPACLLLLVALAPTSSASASALFRGQLVLLYAGATVNKWLDPDWWNGQFLHLYSTSTPHLFFYGDLTTAAGLWPARALSWSTMALEATIAVAFVRARWAPVGILVGLGLHTGIMAWLGFDFDAFFYTVAAAYAGSVVWPSRIEIWLPSSRAGARLVRALACMEWNRLWHVRAAVGSSDERPGGPGDLCVIARYPDRQDSRTGATAWRFLWLHHPTGLVVALALIAAPPSYTPLGWARVWLLAGVVSVAAGWWVYDWALTRRRGAAN